MGMHEFYQEELSTQWVQQKQSYNQTVWQTFVQMYKALVQQCNYKHSDCTLYYKNY